MLEVADAGVGGVHHLAHLQVPGPVIPWGDLGVERFTTEIACGHPGPVLIGKDGVELDGVNAGEIETALFHTAQDIAADVIVEGGAHVQDLLSGDG